MATGFASSRCWADLKCQDKKEAEEKKRLEQQAKTDELLKDGIFLLHVRLAPGMSCLAGAQRVGGSS